MTIQVQIPARPGRKIRGQALTVVGDRHRQLLATVPDPVTTSGDLDAATALGEPVLDGVLNQFGDDERQRRGVLGPQPTEGPTDGGLDRVLARGHLDDGSVPPEGRCRRS